MFKGKIVLITGGTGSFGNAVLDKLLATNVGEIRIFSRDEKKQEDMRLVLKNDRVKFYIGDVRDYNSIADALRGTDFVFHAAALKQVPSCEFYPMEALRTNVMGAENVMRASIASGVKRCVILSTDKAVYPINAMGISKAMMEKVMVATSRNLTSDQTVICGTRYGNVMASRGSVIPLFISQINSGNPITVTDPAMTRFMMTLEDAVDLVIYAFEHGRNGEIFVQKAPAATVGLLAKTLISLKGDLNHTIKTIGTRHGEKLCEALLSREEMFRAEDLGRYYRISPDARDLNYAKYTEMGNVIVANANDGDGYTSHNTHQLSMESMREMLLKLEVIKTLI